MSEELQSLVQIIELYGRGLEGLGKAIRFSAKGAEKGVQIAQVKALQHRMKLHYASEGTHNTMKLSDLEKMTGGRYTILNIPMEDEKELIAFCKNVKPDVTVMVDNCYGEFVETQEPTNVGADMVVGSLIKNLGGGLAPTGGYICGRKSCIERCAYRLSAPGLGREVGANLGLLTSFYQGLFLAPTVVSSAVRGAVFAAACYERLGFRVVPGSGEIRRDIIQAVELGSREAMVAFCKGIQSAAAVDSYVTPEPWAMPGYESEVIMAAGAFVQGSSIELSADGPIRPPYAVYFQGGLTWFHGKLGILLSMQKLADAGIIKL